MLRVSSVQMATHSSQIRWHLDEFCFGGDGGGGDGDGGDGGGDGGGGGGDGGTRVNDDMSCRLSKIRQG